jgi:hypothetical protein
MSTPTRYSSGVSTRVVDHLYGMFPRPDPFQVWSFTDDFNGFTVSSSTTTGWHLDEIDTNTAGSGPTMLDEFGGVVQFEPGSAAGDNCHYQLGNNTTVYEPVKLVAGKKAWFSTCFSVEDVDQNLFFIGCHIGADDILGTEPSDQFGVRSKPSSPGIMQFCAGKTNSTEAVSGDLVTMADTTRYAVYAYYDGKSSIAVQVYTYATDVFTLVGTGTVTVTSSTVGDLLPDTEMTIGFAIEAVDTGNDKLQLDWIHVARER